MLQILQNRAARLVTNCGRFTPTAIRLHQCGWLSVRQLVHYHSLVLAHNMRIQGKPEYFKKHFRVDFPYQTRLAAGHGIRREDRNKYQVTRNSFVARTSSVWNQLPVELRTENKANKFKRMLGLKRTCKYKQIDSWQMKMQLFFATPRLFGWLLL